MARKKFAKLKARMYAMDVRQVDLVPVIGRKTAYITTRMSGKSPWNTAEMKAIGDFLGIPKEQWLDYFMDEEDPEIAKAVQSMSSRKMRIIDSPISKAS